MQATLWIYFIYFLNILPPMKIFDVQPCLYISKFGLSIYGQNYEWQPF